MQDFIAQNWRDTLVRNQMASFDAIWNSINEWVEKPNIRRGGWSGVSRVVVRDENNLEQILYVKCQEGHCYRTLRNPIKGKLTFEREFHNMHKFRGYQVPTPEPVYFAEKKHNKKRRAILITANLSGYISLDEFCNQYALHHKIGFKQKLALMQKIAAEIRQLHTSRMQHGCLYAKHIFVKLDENYQNPAVAFIDFEKARIRLWGKARTARDLRVLPRDIPSVSLKDKLRFYKFYSNKTKLTWFDRVLLNAMERKLKSKGK